MGGRDFDAGRCRRGGALFAQRQQAQTGIGEERAGVREGAQLAAGRSLVGQGGRHLDESGWR